MKNFTKSEQLGTLLILLAISAATFWNLRISERKSRDFQRRDDLAKIYEALHTFHSEFGVFPPSSDGKIKACKGNDFDQKMASVVGSGKDKIAVYLENLSVCEWGLDKFSNLFDPNYIPYMKTIPSDILSQKGYSYRYESNGRVFQLFAHLEGGTSEVGFDNEILRRKISCGSNYCNFGRSAFGKTPLNMNLSEYEEELRKNPELDNQLETMRVN